MENYHNGAPDGTENLTDSLACGLPTEGDMSATCMFLLAPIRFDHLMSKPEETRICPHHKSVRVATPRWIHAMYSAPCSCPLITSVGYSFIEYFTGALM